MIHYIEHPSPVGNLLLASTERGLCGLYFEQHKYFKGKEGWRHDAHQAHLKQAARQLDEYFAETRREFDVTLDTSGTPFQHAVWEALMCIPFGQTASYAQQAIRIGKPRALRAVGTAIGRNPISIIVPCHRVIGTSGAATGYAGGLERKYTLLALEGSPCQNQ